MVYEKKYAWGLRESGLNVYQRFYSLAMRVFNCRNYEEGADSFLNPSLESLNDPFLLADMNIAIERIHKAIIRQERVIVYGDYDVDGITSIALLKKILAKVGYEIDYYIPDRMVEGYGINIEAIKNLCSKYDLMITVDCGITSFEEVKYAMENGLDVIITDHHLPADKLPPAVAIVNPKRETDRYPNKSLAGVGVVFKICQALLTKYYDTEKARSMISNYIGIAAIGTIADIVPLVNENRVIASLGLKRLNENIGSTGLNSLINVSKITDTITSNHIGYRIAPRLNAGGRLGSANDSLEILLTEDNDRAIELAMQLDNQNEKRKYIEKRIETEAIEMLESNLNYNQYFIMLYKDDWHHGVLGIVASRLVERYYRPVILLSSEKDYIKGSGRSIASIHLQELLANHKELLLSFGGHFMAVGLSLKLENLDTLRQKLNLAVQSKCTAADLSPKLTADIIVTVPEINDCSVKELERLQPFGAGNPTPKILLKGVEVKSVALIGKNKHTKLVLGQLDREISCLFWQNSDLGVFPGEIIDIIGTVEKNIWRDRVTVNVIGKDFRKNIFSRLVDKRGTENKHLYINNILAAENSGAIIFYGKDYGFFKEPIENDIRPLGNELILYHTNNSFKVVNTLEGLDCQNIFVFDIPYHRQQIFNVNVGEDICLHLLYNEIDSKQRLEELPCNSISRKMFSDFYRFLVSNNQETFNIAQYKITGHTQSETGVMILTMLKIFYQLNFLSWEAKGREEIYYRIKKFQQKKQLNSSASYLNHLLLIEKAKGEHEFLLSSSENIHQYYLRRNR